MPNIQVLTDPNSGGGVIDQTIQTFFRANSLAICTNGSTGTAHGMAPHDYHDWFTATGSNFFRISGVPVNIYGQADTCGHTRVGSHAAFFQVAS